MGYGGHSADLLFHIIISELQYIIPDSSPKILSGRENYLLGAFIYWAAFIYSGPILGTLIYVYSGCLCSLRQTGIALALVHPDRCISGRDILAKLGSIRPGWQMDDECLELTLRKIEGTPQVSSRLIMEEEFIQEAVDKLVAAWGK